MNKPTDGWTDWQTVMDGLADMTDYQSDWLTTPRTDCHTESWLAVKLTDDRLSKWVTVKSIVSLIEGLVHRCLLTVLLLPLQQFSTIIELVDYYSQHPVDLKSGGSTCLTAACPVRLWSTDSRRSSVVDSICLARTTWNCFCLDVFPTEKRCPRNVRFQLILMLLV